MDIDNVGPTTSICFGFWIGFNLIIDLVYKKTNNWPSDNVTMKYLFFKKMVFDGSLCLCFPKQKY